MLVTVGFVGLCILLGAMVGVAPLPGAVLAGGLGFALLLFIVPVRLALWSALVLCFVLVGPAESIGRVPRVFWLSYLFGLFLFAKALLVWGNVNSGRVQHAVTPSRGVLVVAGFTLMLLVLVGSITQQSSLLEVLLGSREYLWLWGFGALALAARIPEAEQIDWFRALQWVVVLQLPIVVYQHFFVFGSTRFSSHDAVVGLFGGNPEGGGASGAMGFFSLLMALYALARLQNRQVSKLFMFLIVSCALVAIGLAEVKFVAILAPLIALVFFGPRQILKSPKTVAWIFLFLLASPVILYGYWKAFEAPGAGGYASFDRYINLIIERNTDSSQIDMQSGEMGRVAAIKFWKEKNSLSRDPLTFVFGHGVGASRIGVFPGHVAEKFRFRIARSSLTVLLWEFGVAGVGWVVAMLLMGWFTAARVSTTFTEETEAEPRAVSRLVAAVFATALLGLPYNTDLVGTPQFQLLVVLSVVWLASVRERQRRQSAKERGPALSWSVLRKRNG